MKLVNNPYKCIQEKLSEIGIEASLSDIESTTLLVLSTFDIDDRQYLSTHEDELINEIIKQYKFEKEFNKEFGNLLETTIKKTLGI